MFDTTFRRLGKNIFLLDYREDYGLDDLLSHGVTSVGGLMLFVQKRFLLKRKDVKIKNCDFGCTTFNSFTQAGEHIFARNFDYKEAPCIVVWTAPKNGYKSVGITSADVLLCDNNIDKRPGRQKRLLAAPFACMDGVNEKGLSIAVVKLNVESTKQETGKIPVITTVMIRAVLDKCADVEEAIEMFSKYDMHDSLKVAYHYQLTDASGKSAIIEYIDNKMVVYRADRERQYLVNFYHSPGVAVRTGSGYTREKWLIDEFSQTGLVMNEDRALKILERCHLCYKHKKGYMVQSLWSAVYNCSKQTLSVCVGMDYSKKYTFGVEYKEPVC